MTPKYILNASIAAMRAGTKEPHCFSAWQKGEGYTNKGTNPATRADYLTQLAHRAQSEIDNLGFSPAYAEPGYDQPKHGIVLADWNCFPSRIDQILERAGYAVEWSDEWSTCEDCNKLFRTSADSYCWEPAYKMHEGSELCLACYDDAHTHTTDSDCTLDACDVCTVCHVYHGDPCPHCQQRGFHTADCPDAA